MSNKIINQIISGVVAIVGLGFSYAIYVNTKDSTLATAISMAIVAHYFSVVAHTNGSNSVIEGASVGKNQSPSNSQKPIG